MIHIDSNITLSFRRKEIPLHDNDPVVHHADPELSEFKCKSVKLWMENYYNGYNKFKKAKDVKELVKKINRGEPALVVGAGPSIRDFGHIELLKGSNFSGAIFSSNKSLITLLDAEIIPTAVVAIEAHEVVLKSFDIPLEKYPELCKKIPLVMSTTVCPKLYDLWKGPKYVFNVYHGEMVSYFMNQFSPHTMLKLCGDVGSTCWIIAAMCNKDPIALIGMDFGYKDPVEDTIAYKLYQQMGVPGDLHRFFRRDENTYFKNSRLVDSVFQGYLSAFQYITSSADVTTINCTEAGSLHDGGFMQMYFKEFLDLDEKKKGDVFV